MTNKIYLIKSKNQSAVDSCLIEQGFTPELLSQIRLIPDMRERVVFAAEEFAKLNLTSFSYDQLSAVVMPVATSSKSRKLTTALHKLYDSRQAELSIRGVKTTLMHLLRDATGNYQGNLLSAKDLYSDFKVSDDNWRKQIRIPTTIDREVSQVLGLLWVDGKINKLRDWYYTLLEGAVADAPLYVVMIPLIQSVFNYTPNLKLRSKKNSPLIKIHSKCINDWLIYDMNFDTVDNSRVRVLPKIDLNNTVISAGFLEGIVAARANLDNVGARLEVGDRKNYLRSAVCPVFDKQGIPYSDTKRGILLSQKATLDFLAKYTLLNPVHQERAKIIFEKNNLDWDTFAEEKGYAGSLHSYSK